MTETHGRLIDTAVKPLADNAELQLAAAALLEEAKVRSNENADDLIARWEEVDAKKKQPWVKWVFISVLVGLSAWAWTVAGRQGLVYWRLENMTAEFMSGDDYSQRMETLQACMPGDL